jgi:hypothetical protein
MALVFSYGSLQEEAVQLETFGRRLTGFPDALVGYETELVPVTRKDDPHYGRKTHHLNLKANGRAQSRVAGTALDVSDAELALTNRFEERSGYARIAARTAGGRDVWLYVAVPA